MTTNRMINATNTALDQAPEALDGVRVNVADHVDVFAVIDSLVRVSARSQAIIGTERIG